MSTVPAATFTGTSKYAADLQSALNRALSIAALPTQQIVTQKATTDSQVTEIGNIGSLLTTLQNSLTSLSSSGTGSNALAATSSDTSVATASLTGSALAGTYTIQVLDPGSFSSALSNAGSTPVTDPSSQSITSASSLNLTVDGTSYTLSPTSNSLNALAASINSSGAPVQATIINLGSPSAPDYRLAIQSTKLGDFAIQLNDGSDLLNSVTTGTPGSYTVNGQPSGGISTDSRTVTVAPGLDVSLGAAGTTTVNVAGSTTAISSALTAFVNGYNAAITELQKNHGQGGGALTGDSSILSIQTTLRGLINYSGGTNGVNGLSDLGIEFTQSGTLTFDTTKLSSLGTSQINDVVSFLGDPNTGGFLKAASDAFNALLDPVDGLVPNEQTLLQNRSTQEGQAISDAQDRLTQLQTQLQAQFAAADALITTLQNQSDFLDGLFNINNSTSSNGSSSSGN